MRTYSEIVAGKDPHDFYISSEWLRLRREVLAEQHYECQMCKRRGQYTRATHVHHVWHVDKFPQHSLSKTVRDGDEEKINLIAVCKDCHETVCHPERLRHTKKPLTKERW